MLHFLHLLEQPLLALLQGFLAVLLLADVDHVALRVQRLADLVADDDGRVVDPDDVAVASDQAVLAIERIAAGVHRGEAREHARPILGVQRWRKRSGQQATPRRCSPPGGRSAG